MKQTVSYISDNERGATMIEAMIVLPILFATVFFIVWYSRSMHENNMMNEAMYRAGKIASTVPNLDLSLVSTDAEKNDKQKLSEFNRAKKANEMARDAAYSFLNSVGFDKDPKAKMLLPLTKDIQRIKPDGTPLNPIPVTITGEVFALLPSECVTYTDPRKPTVLNNVCNNKSIDPTYSDSVPLPASVKQTLQPQKILLKQFPIKIVAVANRSASIFNGGGGLKEFNFYIVREPIPAGPFTQDIETFIGNGDVDNGVPPDPLKFAELGDEVGATVTCHPSTGQTASAAVLINYSRTNQNNPCEIRPNIAIYMACYAPKNNI